MQEENYATRNSSVFAALAAIALSMVIAGCSSSSDMSRESGGLQSPIPATPAASNLEFGEANKEAPVDAPVVTAAENQQPALGTELSAETESGIGISNAACDASAEEFASAMLAVINRSRQSDRMCGNTAQQSVATVSWNSQLTTAAQSHAEDMANHNFFDHTGSDGLSVSNRATSAGYNWRAVGENIAAGQDDIDQVHEGWLKSAGHCRNIMNPLFAEVGAACIRSDRADFQSYWVVVFGDTL